MDDKENFHIFEEGFTCNLTHLKDLNPWKMFQIDQKKLAQEAIDLHKTWT